jgi:hypothetical protein
MASKTAPANPRPISASKRYADTMSAYAEASSSLLARLDGCPCGASAPHGAVKPASGGGGRPIEATKGN